MAVNETQEDLETEKKPSAYLTSKRLKRRHFLAVLGAVGVSLSSIGIIARLSGHGKIAAKSISAISSKDKAELGALKQQYSGEANVSLQNALVDQGVSRENANLLTNQQLLEASVPAGQKLGTTQLVLDSSNQTPSLQLPINSAIEDPYARMQADLERALAKPIDQRRWGMVIDQRKCIGCSSCTVACKAENHLPPGVVYRPVINNEVGTYPNVSMQFTPRPCMQCDNPPCVPVCPVDATFKRADGIVVIDYDVCIGCRYCITACPYQARTFDWGLYYTSNTPKLEPYETAPSFEYNKEWPREGMDSPIDNTRKCHFCIQRLDAGILPACVTTCLGRATYFGDLNDPQSLVSELAALPNAMRLKEELGTEPKVYYLV